ncbi:MAG: biopolymer transporter ExbD [Ignavibacteria bacterium]|nr:biopolymer transporter ExbD [Ignavibacteria bacterium]
MPKIKHRRVGVRIDMTPLVDIAFLLLTFFMMTSQFKPPEEVDISLPMSNSEIALPESNVMALSLSNDGRIFMGFSSQRDMARLFGAENALRAAVEVPKEDLADYLIKARMGNLKLVTVIKGDRDTEFGLAEDVMDILQKTTITRFNLVTDLANKEREGL